MAKKDLPERLQGLYFPTSKEPVFVNVPTMQFATVEGEGDPNTSQDFKDAIGALYGVAYTAKFAAKKAGLADVKVMPLEALWWSGDTDDILAEDKGRWHWMAMLMEPPAVTRPLFDDAVRQLREKKDPPALDKVRLKKFREGRSGQVLHVGPYAAEAATIKRLHAFIKDHGYRMAGKHHEIYLSIPGRTAPARLRTVVRQPVSR